MVKSRIRYAFHSIGAVKSGHSDRQSYILSLVHGGGPGVQFGVGDAYQAAGRVQPHRTVVVFDSPVHRVARQSVLAGHRSQAIVLQPAEATFSGDPESSVITEVKVADTACAEAIWGCVGCADLTVSKIDDSPSVKSNPQATPAMITSENAGIIVMSEV